MTDIPKILTDLEKTEALSAGDPCEFRYPARRDWHSGFVLCNGGLHYWTVQVVETGKKVYGLYIEHVRAVGTDPWPPSQIL